MNRAFTDRLVLLLLPFQKLVARADELTALMAASTNAHVEVVGLLLEHGASVEPPPGSIAGGALFMACQEGHARIARLLLERGASPQESLGGSISALMAAAFFGRSACVQLLLDAG